MFSEFLCISQTALNNLSVISQETITKYIESGIATDLAKFEPKLTISNGIGVIDISGIIERRPSIMSMIFGGSNSLSIKSHLNVLNADSSIKAILLNIDSPGGEAMGIQEVADLVHAINKTKPVFAHVSGFAASAAFWIASQAGSISSEKSAQTGSIGAVKVIMDQSQHFANEGVRPIIIKTGEFKMTGVPGSEITDEQIADETRLVNAIFADFKDSVMRGRGMTAAKLDPIADGRMFTATEALELGLIDKVESMENVFSKISRGRKATLSKETASRRIRVRAI